MVLNDDIIYLFFVPFKKKTGRHTAKAQVGINASGIITSVFPAYGGRASDKHLFLDTKIIDRCGKGDSIIVDKGYPISKECQDKGKQCFFFI